MPDNTEKSCDDPRLEALRQISKLLGYSSAILIGFGEPIGTQNGKTEFAATCYGVDRINVEIINRRLNAAVRGIIEDAARTE